jgi:hypothetical protein
MPSSRPRTPKYRHYKPKNLAVVRIFGRDHYLGKYLSPESHERYDRLIAEWLVGRHQPKGTIPFPSSTAIAEPARINELILAFWHHAKRRYVKNGQRHDRDSQHHDARECRVNGRFVAIMDQFMPKWQFRRQVLNQLPVRHERWGY